MLSFPTISLEVSRLITVITFEFRSLDALLALFCLSFPLNHALNALSVVDEVDASV
jgi:hypothetical protein